MEARLTELGALRAIPKVWDVGAFEGAWTDDLLARYPEADVTLFEPVPGYSAALRDGGFEVKGFGLSDKDKTADITIAGDRSSTHTMGYAGTGHVQITLFDVASILGEQHLDVMKLNVEGEEYAILERLLDTDKLRQVNIFLIQFHTFIKDFGERYLAIKKRMEQTHSLIWRTPFVWERWDRRNNG